MTYPKDIKIAAPEQFAFLNDPDFLNQAVTGFLHLACFHFPQKHRKRIRTTNLLERLNREIKRRADVVQIFPNEKAVSTSDRLEHFLLHRSLLRMKG